MIKTREKRLKKSTRATYKTGANAIINLLKKKSMSYRETVKMLRQRGTSRTVINILKEANLIKITGQKVSINEAFNDVNSKKVNVLIERGLKDVALERKNKTNVKSVVKQNVKKASVKASVPNIKNDNGLLADIVVKLIGVGQIKKAHEIANKIK